MERGALLCPGLSWAAPAVFQSVSEGDVTPPPGEDIRHANKNSSLMLCLLEPLAAMLQLLLGQDQGLILGCKGRSQPQPAGCILALFLIHLTP